MTTTNTSGKIKRSKFPATFYVANTMEMFERLAWYGFFTVAALYMSSPTSLGGLNLNDTDRGVLSAVMPFLLYVFPVVTGAIADRVGYRKMLILSFALMTPAYFMMGQVDNFWSFAFFYFCLAVGAAIFKPLILGTVARVSDDTNRSVGVGIFYTMVNVGGFVGPIIMGYAQAISWSTVFIISSLAIAVNFIPVIFMYKEPVDTKASEQKSIMQVLAGAQEVVGNGRFSLLIFSILVLAIITAGSSMTWMTYLYITAGLIVFNILWDQLLDKNKQDGPWLTQRMQSGNKAFLCYLLIVAGYWTTYQQLYYTFPLYMRDFVDTQPVLQFLYSINLGSIADFLSNINIDGLNTGITEVLRDFAPLINEQNTVQQAILELSRYQVQVPAAEVQQALTTIAHTDTAAIKELANTWATNYKQIASSNYIAIVPLTILTLQIPASHFIARFNAFSVMITGAALTGISMALWGLVPSAFILAFLVMTFALGEVLYSAKSQEYIAAIAPKDKVAVFVAYYFVGIAISMLVSGIISGEPYAYISKELGKPELFWIMIGSISVLSSIGLIIMNTLVIKKKGSLGESEADEQQSSAQEQQATVGA